MKNQLLSLAFIGTVCWLASGCYTMRPVGNCNSCGPLRNLAGVCGESCGGCGSCDSCSGISLGCSSGCGETYVGERFNVRPTCDPCGYQGDYTGASCGPCGTQLPILHRFARLFAIGYLPACGGCNESGCSDCGYSTSMESTEYQVPSPQGRSDSSDRSLLQVPSEERITPVPDPNVSRRTSPQSRTKLASSTGTRLSPAHQKHQGSR